MITWPKAILPSEDVVRLFKHDGTLVRGFNGLSEMSKYCDSIEPVDYAAPVAPDAVKAWANLWYAELSPHFHHLLSK